MRARSPARHSRDKRMPCAVLLRSRVDINLCKCSRSTRGEPGPGGLARKTSVC